MRKLTNILLIFSLLLLITGCKTEEETPVIKYYTITPYFTKGDKTELLQVQNQVQTLENTDQKINVINIDPNITYQVMDGFGAAMTESSAYLFSQMSETQRAEALSDLFGENGIKINFVRLPIGSSDFALSNYSYNDILEGTEDLNMEQFSIQRDFDYVIPMIKEAQSFNPDIKFLGSPWSAPAWMKDTKTMNGGSLLQQYFDAYALYFVKFIQSYEAEGIDIYAVTPQNEPLHQINTYPTMYMSANDQSVFVNKLGQSFNQNNIDTLIIGYDHNWTNPYPSSILGNPLSNPYLAGVAYHSYGGEVSSQETIHKLYPEKGIWFTESSGGQWATDFAANMTWNMQNVFIGSINYYSKGVMMWNLALDDNFGPTNGGCTNCRGVLTVHEDGSYTKNEEYYMIGHFSKFVEAGAIRIDSTSNNQGLLVTSFLNPNGDIVIVAHNKNNSQLSFNLNVGGSSAVLNIPASTTATYVLQNIK